MLRRFSGQDNGYGFISGREQNVKNMRKESVLLVGAVAILLVACDVQEHNPDTVNHKNTALSPWDNNDGSSDRKQHSRNMLTKSDEEDAPRDKHKVRHHHGARPSVKPPHTSRKRKGRCRRYSQRYYQVNPNAPVFMPSYNRRYPPPNYPPPQYIVPSRYYPCRSYCVPCVTSTCRRRCPNYPGGSTATATITVTSTAVTKSTKPTAVITVVTDPRKSSNINVVLINIKHEKQPNYYQKSSEISYFHNINI